MFRYILAINQILNMHQRAAQEEQEKMHDFPLVQPYCSHQEAEREL